MAIDILKIVFGGFIASIVWFIIGSIFYTNPYISKLHKKFSNSLKIKQWKNTFLFLLVMYFVILLHCLLFAFVYSFIKPVLPGAVFANGIFFGLILIAVSQIPDISTRWVLTTYPNQLLFVDIINGIAGSLIIGLTLALTI